MNDDKEELVEHMQDIVGQVPENVRLVIKLLSHPDLIKFTKRYFNSIDKAGRCRNYEPPWSCAREAEAKYENLKFGWLGGLDGVGYSDHWCEPCRSRVMEND